MTQQSYKIFRKTLSLENWLLSNTFMGVMQILKKSGWLFANTKLLITTKRKIKNKWKKKEKKKLHWIRKGVPVSF